MQTSLTQEALLKYQPPSVPLSVGILLQPASGPASAPLFPQLGFSVAPHGPEPQAAVSLDHSASHPGLLSWPTASFLPGFVLALENGLFVCLPRCLSLSLALCITVCLSVAVRLSPFPPSASLCHWLSHRLSLYLCLCLCSPSS